jgi:hypothetical protein
MQVREINPEVFFATDQIVSALENGFVAPQIVFVQDELKERKIGGQTIWQPICSWRVLTLAPHL